MEEDDLKEELDLLVEERSILRESFSKGVERCNNLCKSRDKNECGRQLFVLKEKFERLKEIDNEIKAKARKVWSVEERKHDIETCEEFYEQMSVLEYDVQRMKNGEMSSDELLKYTYNAEVSPQTMFNSEPMDQRKPEMDPTYEVLLSESEPEGEEPEEDGSDTGQNNDSSPDDERDWTPKRSKNQIQKYKFVKKFECKKDADEYIRQEDIWSNISRRKTKAGVKSYFRCNMVKRRGRQCTAKLYMLIDAFSSAVLVYKTENSHDHEGKDVSCYGLSDRVKSEINKMDDLRMNSKAMVDVLGTIPGISVPKISQIRTYLRNRRSKNKSETTIDLNELKTWLSSRAGFSSDLHKVYVVGFEADDEIDNPMFRFVLSTRHLLATAGDYTVVHADFSNTSSFSLHWQGYPVQVLGSTDKNKKFRPFAVAITTGDEIEDFKFIFEVLKTALEEMSLGPKKMEGTLGFQPEVLVCNVSEATQDAFKEVFGDDVTVRTCWAHARRKMNSQIEKLADDSVHAALLEDIDFLHAVTDPETFNLASRAFLIKWKNHTSFIKTFKEQWLTKYPNWYLGVHMGSPANNDGLDAFQRSVKDELRERLPMARFLAVACELISSWSSKEDDIFATTPTITMKMWTEAYQWTLLPKEVIQIQSNETFDYYEVPAGLKNKVVVPDECNNFEDVKAHFFSKWTTALPIQEDWVQGKCNCPGFFKDYMCKHLAGLAIRLELAVPPPQATVTIPTYIPVPGGVKRRPGRPSKAKSDLKFL